MKIGTTLAIPNVQALIVFELEFLIWERTQSRAFPAHLTFKYQKLKGTNQ